MATSMSPLVEHAAQVYIDCDTFGLGVPPAPPTHRRYRAECSCGWSGAWTSDDAEAAADATGHLEVAVVAIDQLMSELLDTQADLAEVVEWLAEHWSADLPVPWRALPGPG